MAKITEQKLRSAAVVPKPNSMRLQFLTPFMASLPTSNQGKLKDLCSHGSTITNHAHTIPPNRPTNTHAPPHRLVTQTPIRSFTAEPVARLSETIFKVTYNRCHVPIPAAPVSRLLDQGGERAAHMSGERRIVVPSLRNLGG